MVTTSSMSKWAAGDSARKRRQASSIASRPTCRLPSGGVVSSKTQSSVMAADSASISWLLRASWNRWIAARISSLMAFPAGFVGEAGSLSIFIGLGHVDLPREVRLDVGADASSVMGVVVVPVSGVERVEPPRTAGEREMLESWVDYYRATMLLKCEGLTGEQL